MLPIPSSPASSMETKTLCNTPGEIICLTSAIANTFFALLHISFFNPLKNLLHLSISVGPLIGYLAFSFLKHQSAKNQVDIHIETLETATQPPKPISDIDTELLELHAEHATTPDGPKIEAILLAYSEKKTNSFHRQLRKQYPQKRNRHPLDTNLKKHLAKKHERDRMIANK